MMLILMFVFEEEKFDRSARHGAEMLTVRRS